MVKPPLDLNQIPKRRLSDVEKQYIELTIEKLKLKRERNLLVLNKGSSLYVVITVVGIVGVLLDKINLYALGVYIIGGLLILVISILPYLNSTKKEEDDLIRLLDFILGKES